MYVSILTCPSEQLKHTSPLMLSGKKTFSHGTVIPSFTHSSKKVMLCLCSKSLFSQLAASTGETEHILQTSMRNTLTKQTTNTVRRYRNADNVSLFCSPPPVSVFYYLSLFVILSWALSAVLFECSNVSHGWWWGKKNPVNISSRLSPRLQDLESSSLLNRGPPLPFIVTF